MEVGLKVCDMPELYGAVLRLNMLIKHIMSQCFVFVALPCPRRSERAKRANHYLWSNTTNGTVHLYCNRYSI